MRSQLPADELGPYIHRTDQRQAEFLGTLLEFGVDLDDPEQVQAMALFGLNLLKWVRKITEATQMSVELATCSALAVTLRAVLDRMDALYPSWSIQ